MQVSVDNSNMKWKLLDFLADDGKDNLHPELLSLGGCIIYWKEIGFQCPIICTVAFEPKTFQLKSFVVTPYGANIKSHVVWHD